MYTIKGKQITNSTITQSNLKLSYPTLPDNAATKQYVDLQTYSVTGLTDVNGTPSTNNQLLVWNDDNQYFDITNTITGDLTIVGDLYISGTTTSIDVSNMEISDNIILLNSGETNAGVSLINAGIEVDRGILTNYQFIFNETADVFKIGEVGYLQAVATREDEPTISGISYWSDIDNMFITSNNFIFDNNDLCLPNMTNSGTSHIVHYNNTTGRLTYENFSTLLSFTNGGDNRLLTYNTESNINAESNLTFDGYVLTLTNSLAKYSSDYSESYTDRSLVDKGFVMNQISSIDISGATIPSLNTITGITSNTFLGTLPSNETLSMVYIRNNGTITATINLGTSVTGNDISLYDIQIDSGDEISITVNQRLSSVTSQSIYINSSDWSKINLDVDWSKLTYSDVPNIISQSTLHNLPIAPPFTYTISTTSYPIDLSVPYLYKVVVDNGVTILDFSLLFNTDSSVNSREIIVDVDNRNNNSAISIINFDDNGGTHTWRWGVGVKPTILAANTIAQLFIYNTSDTEVKTGWEIEE